VAGPGCLEAGGAGGVVGPVVLPRGGQDWVGSFSRLAATAIHNGGRLVWFGVAATSKAGMRVIPLSLLTRLGLTLIPDGKRAPMPPNAGRFAQTTLAALLDSLAAGKIKPIVAERIPLAEAARAHVLLERGGHAGKVALVAGL
jgi:NADPH:quinone reductase-like Zn-dependent oxidoreductase